MTKLTLISFATCPYVQRAVIALKEKAVAHEVIYVDLSNKPDWFLAISPLGKVPVLRVEHEGQPPVHIFESAVILEYLEETTPHNLHPADPLERAHHRAYIEFASQTLADLWKFTSAKSQTDLDAARTALVAKLERLERTVAGPFFAGTEFSYVDSAFAPAFRQIDILESVSGAGLLEGLAKVDTWRHALGDRPSVQDAVPSNYTELYLDRIRGNDAQILRRAA